MSETKTAPGQAKSNLEAFAATLEELAAADRNVLAVVSDSRGSGKLGPFGKKFPDQIVEVGIAEQNLVGVAAGLASAGKKVFAVSPASFLTARSLEQIKNDVAYSDNPVVMVGISAGVSYGALGSTHHSLHDFAALRAINNIEIVAPADNSETRAAVLAAAGSRRPVYLRFGKRPVPDLYAGGFTFTPGKANVLRKGSDVAFIATGETVGPALKAADLLQAKGITCTVVSMHTVKPMDTDTLFQAARDCRLVLTVEEHMANGGLGEACASALLQKGLHPLFRILAIPDEPTFTGGQMEIFEHYGLHPEGLARSAFELLAD